MSGAGMAEFPVVPRRPPSSSVPLNGRIGSARRTQLSEETLQRLVGIPTSRHLAPPPARQTNSIMIQTRVGMGDVHLLETLVGSENTVGVVTVAHARDVDIFRCYQLRMLETAIRDEERERHMVLSQEAELRRSLTLVNITMLQKIRAFKMLATARREGQSPRKISVAFDRSLIDAAGSPGSGDFSLLPSPTSIGSPTARDEEELNRMRERLLLLEERVRSSAKSTKHNVASVARRAIAQRSGSAGSRSQGGASDPAVEAFLLQQEASNRLQMSKFEVEARKTISLALSQTELEAQLRIATRVMVHAPFTSYRPKIPIQHSLAGEEYLRRWLLVETLQHYEDCATLLQQHENDKRNSIEDEYAASIHMIFATVFLPHYESRSATLEAALSREKERAASQQRQSDSLYATLKLKVIVAEESTIREVLKASCFEMLSTLRLVVLELADLRGVHAKAKRLEGELARQARRRQEEVGFLVSQLPRAGVIHPNSAMLAELNARSTTATGSPDLAATQAPSINPSTMKITSAASYRVPQQPSSTGAQSYNTNDMYPLGVKVQSILMKHSTASSSSSGGFARPASPTSQSQRFRHASIVSTCSTPDGDEARPVPSGYFAGF